MTSLGESTTCVSPLTAGASGACATTCHCHVCASAERAPITKSARTIPSSTRTARTPFIADGYGHEALATIQPIARLRVAWLPLLAERAGAQHLLRRNGLRDDPVRVEAADRCARAARRRLRARRERGRRRAFARRHFALAGAVADGQYDLRERIRFPAPRRRNACDSRSRASPGAASANSISTWRKRSTT